MDIKSSYDFDTDSLVVKIPLVPIPNESEIYRATHRINHLIHSACMTNARIERGYED